MGFDTTRHEHFPERQPDRPPLFIGSIWAAGISLVLSLVPIFGAFVGGLVGGWLVGNARRGLGASVIAVVLYALFLPLIPYAGVFRATPTDEGTTIALAAAALIIGGVIGGAASNRQPRGHAPAR